MSETGSPLVSPEFVEKMALFSSVLEAHQIHVPELPPTDTTGITAPRDWLLRGEAQKVRLIEPKHAFFTPQKGEWGTNGIFFGDCLKPLAYPSQGAWYIYKTAEISSEWLVTPSQQFSSEVEKIAHAKHLSLSSISGGVEAEAEVYKHHDIYQARKGIATVSHPLSIEQAHAVVVTKDFLLADDLARIPPTLKEKLIIMH